MANNKLIGIHLKVECAIEGVTRKHWPPVRRPPLRTGPRTTPTDPLTDHPQNSIKNRNISLTASPIDHSRRRNFEIYAGKNVTDLGSVSGTRLSLYIAISFAVAITIHERPGKLWDTSKFVLLFPVPLCSAYSPAGSLTRPGFHNLLSGISNINKFIDRPKSRPFQPD